MGHTPVLQIDSHTDLTSGVAVRRLVSMVLLLAIKDRAAEVRFEPCLLDRQWRLREQVGDTWYEMVPVPLHVPVSQELRRLAGLGGVRRLLGFLSRLVFGAPGCKKRIRLRVAGHVLELVVTRVGPGRAETVALRLPEHALPSEEAHRILMEYIQSGPPVESSESWE